MSEVIHHGHEMYLLFYFCAREMFPRYILQQEVNPEFAKSSAVPVVTCRKYVAAGRWYTSGATI